MSPIVQSLYGSVPIKSSIQFKTVSCVFISPQLLILIIEFAGSHAQH